MSHSQVIETALSRWKAEGRSSPAGRDWHDFWTWLNENRSAGAAKPPGPLILAASGASNAAKHQCLRKQLEWADASGLLHEALSRLDGIPSDCWNIGDSRRWNEDNWP